MCRFVYYQGQPIRLASLLTEPEHSLVHQSFHSHERVEPLNGDGFGVGWYDEGDPDPAVFRSVTPAWSNQNLTEIARVTRSRRVLAHVRAATQGSDVSVVNCHPFRMGGLAFMHNGELGGFEAYRRPLLEGLSDGTFHAIHGSTDSEHFLALIVEALPAASETDAGADRLAVALEMALERVLALRDRHAAGEHVFLNGVLTDGRAAVACRITTDAPERADTLYVRRGERYACVDGVARMLPCPDGHASVLIASEPLTQDPGWSAVEVGDVVLIDEDQTVRSGRRLPS